MRSKRKGELAAQRFADRVAITVIRPPVVLGEWDRQGVTLFQTIDRLGIHLVPGWATHRYSLIHANDLANALILAAQRGSRLTPPGCQADQSAVRGFYFVAAEENVTYAELGRLVGKALGRRRVWTFRVGMAAVRVISVRRGTGIPAPLPHAVFESRQGPRGHGGLMDLLPPSGNRRFRVLGRRPALGAAAPDGRVVS